MRGEEEGVAGSQLMSIKMYTGAQINFGYLTPYLRFCGEYVNYLLACPGNMLRSCRPQQLSCSAKALHVKIFCGEYVYDQHIQVC